ncbi:MAG: hypothetical protein DMG05_01605 [Acidobacteria bacterium]|nr:MAG: hypothetical protein DMG05_01605 [Acidobacteriota bacterium]
MTDLKVKISSLVSSSVLRLGSNRSLRVLAPRREAFVFVRFEGFTDRTYLTSNRVLPIRREDIPLKSPNIFQFQSSHR